MDEFTIAAGSVPGTDHTKPGQPLWKNNQDAHDFQVEKDFLIGVVCDGCGGVENGYSEFGARLGARLVAKNLADFLAAGASLANSTDEVLEQVAQRVTEQLKFVAEMGTVSRLGRDAFANQHFLFTIVGVAVTKETTLVFSYGDGVFAVNGDVSVIPPYPENQPPYIAYRFMSSDVDPSLFRFETRALLPTAEVSSVLIGSDGLVDFIAAADTPLPVSGKPLGPLSQFWEEDKYINNSDMVRRCLALTNREHTEDGLIKGGLLHDDTTLLLVRRV